jgi:hypothetical protein
MHGAVRVLIELKSVIGFWL